MGRIARAKYRLGRIALVSLVSLMGMGVLTTSAFAQIAGITSLEVTAVDQTATFTATVCGIGGAGTWHVLIDPGTQYPTLASIFDTTGAYIIIPPLFCMPDLSVDKENIDYGLHTAVGFVIDNGILTPNGYGPVEFCIGYDVRISDFTLEIDGAYVIYRAKVCNTGSVVAKKFRVGFWHDQSADPAAQDMGDLFVPIASLDVGACEDVEIRSDQRPNGSFAAWGRVDAGDFLEDECYETDNTSGPTAYTLSNPDLYVSKFSSKVNGKKVDYDVEVCNQGTKEVGRFFVDLYYDRPLKAPRISEPGDESQPVQSLAPDKCTSLKFSRSSVTDGKYISYILIDADDFISEPNEGNNLSMPEVITIGNGGTTTPGGGNTSEFPSTCEDKDGDGHGYGPGCTGVPDCNDNDITVHYGASEICGDKIDQDCDLTPDDGCPGVACNDSDGDSFGVGADCVLSDCNDTDAEVHPWAKEKCGDNADDNCNGIADDGCIGRQCIDGDADGYGIGAGCPGAQDCNDLDHFVNPGAAEFCGDGIDNDCDLFPDDGCATGTDKDGDGHNVGGTGQPDCNDNDPNIGPGKPEICGDGIDNDCDLTVDDGCEGVQCTDTDGDGWGVGIDCVLKDCNDADASVHPWAEEICADGVDNDCDETIDDGCPDVDCVDSDNDGFGVGKDCTTLDCNDSDGGISPWATEICADDKDNNCDGQIDEDCIICTDKDGDGHGIGPKCLSWDCNDEDDTVHPNAEEVCDGQDNNCDETTPDTEKSCESGGGKTGCTIGDADKPASWPASLILSLLAIVALAYRRRPVNS
jgi:hypothetical protein